LHPARRPRRGDPEPGGRDIFIDWLWSIAFYTAAIVALIGAYGVVRPLRRVHRGKRTHALVMLLIALAAIYAVSRSMPRTQAGDGRHLIDAFVPAYQFREIHSTTVEATPDRIDRAIRGVSADEIALFNVFTWIRRFGRSGPESILNAPRQRPILDVATQTGFLRLGDRPLQEIVIGTVVVAPPGTARPQPFTPVDYQRLTRPGFALAAMNFRIEPVSATACRVITETRVFATDAVALRRFTPYWRIIFPGSAILRVTWLRAVKHRAERVS
jgi:hypothetical protein